MTSLCEVGAVQEFGRLATRAAGADARRFISDALKKCEVVRINMIGMNVSPSFADECFGLLAAELGLEQYGRRVQLINVPEAAEDLIRLVVYRRGAPQQRTKKGLSIPIPPLDEFLNDFTKATKREKK
jgi:hypothetical protein